MTEKPTYEQVEQRVRELEKAELERKIAVDGLRESEKRYRYLPNLSWWIPFIGSCLLLLKEILIYLEIRDFANYICDQEEDFLGKNGGGWETSLAQSASAIRGFRIPWAALAFWGVLISTTLVGPFWLKK